MGVTDTSTEHEVLEKTQGDVRLVGSERLVST